MGKYFLNRIINIIKEEILSYIKIKAFSSLTHTHTHTGRQREHEIKEIKNGIMSSSYIELLQINKKKATQ